ncbi:lysylphosphatidylglycerol synthase domain-containing protein [Chelatococcus sp. SYSU_G07232]|uniref:Lysylphosphatidylglycerol synthase domain-containing protein n=1 Tax=Chelatococcus albus TaxID=3047466 RepID=A0ABT7AFI0_9HYPH|nr:lysylphosphatidylglycerol synthase domain-containing protein [Chelatococcus sp. SYSU_G07232]MDJ1158129.1 lysylphosphatidylglycerol synthase domain-containing protein [Chelatococcus sp. SYSU_G07232]
MKKKLEYVWPVVGLLAVVFSFWLLYKELKGISASDLVDSLSAISARHWFLAAGATLVAYAALAWYDRIALLHLGKKLSWVVISLVSFTTYALSHNIGASVLSGAMVRLRAYGTMGLSLAEVGVLVALCSFTFGLGTVLLGGLVLVLQPEIVQRLFDVPTLPARLAGAGMLAFVTLYVLGSWREFKPLTIGSFHIYYPRLHITARQLIAAPLELLGAAGIIYFALPEAGNPGFFVVLGVFLASFSAALISHAPGGLGVLEFVFLKAMPDLPQADVLAALLVFRLLYLLVPLAFSTVVVILFERSRLSKTLQERLAGRPVEPHGTAVPARARVRVDDKAA